MELPPHQINYIDTTIFSMVVFASRLNYIMPCGRMQPAIPEAYLELVLAPRRVKVARPPGYMALTSYSEGLHHVISEDRCSASFQQPSAPLRAPVLAVLPPNVVFHARIWAPLSELRLSLVRDSNRFHSGRRMLPPFLTAGLAVFSKESASGA